MNTNTYTASISYYVAVAGVPSGDYIEAKRKAELSQEQCTNEATNDSGEPGGTKAPVQQILLR